MIGSHPLRIGLMPVDNFFSGFRCGIWRGISIGDFTLRVEQSFGISLELLRLGPPLVIFIISFVVLLVEADGQFHFICIDSVSLCWDFHVLTS